MAAKARHAAALMAEHVRELSKLLGRFEPEEPGRERIEARLEEAREAMKKVSA